jgi:DNA polymerase III epsilon subunit-like protein
MSIEKIPTSDGVKLYDTTKKELAGSIGSGKTKIPTVKPVAVPVLLIPTLEETENKYNEVYSQLISVSVIAKLEIPLSETSLVPNEESVLSSEVAPKKESKTKMTKDDLDSHMPANITSPAELVALSISRGTAGSDLDKLQLDEVYRLLIKGVQRKVGSLTNPASDPTDEEWQAWLTDSKERLLDINLDISDAERATALLKLEEAAQGPKPKAFEFGLAVGARKKVWSSKFDMDEGYKQISAWYDTSPVNIKLRVQQFRREYLEAEALGEAPEIDEIFLNGYKSTSGSSPKDLASIYAHQMADDPELYDPTVIPTTYIAFDTETSGLSTRDGARVLQVGLVKYDQEGVEIDRFVSLIRPQKNEDGIYYTGGEKAIGVHGILPEHLVDAPEFADVWPKIKSWFDEGTIVGQNVIGFDKKLMENEVNILNDGDRSASSNIWPRAADTLWYAKRWLSTTDEATGKQIKLDNYKLSTLADLAGVGLFKAHDAGEDADATAKVFFALKKAIRYRQLQAKAKRDSEDSWSLIS